MNTYLGFWEMMKVFSYVYSLRVKKWENYTSRLKTDNIFEPQTNCRSELLGVQLCNCRTRGWILLSRPQVTQRPLGFDVKIRVQQLNSPDLVQTPLSCSSRRLKDFQNDNTRQWPSAVLHTQDRHTCYSYGECNGTNMHTHTNTHLLVWCRLPEGWPH